MKKHDSRADSHWEGMTSEPFSRLSLRREPLEEREGGREEAVRGASLDT